MSYNWQQPDWPQFRYDLTGVQDALFAFAERTGRAGGLLKGLTADAQMETSIELMVVEAIKTSAIEGELLSRKDVMSSIRNNLGLAPDAPGGDTQTTESTRFGRRRCASPSFICILSRSTPKRE